jgi:hypothetical protein
LGVAEFTKAFAKLSKLVASLLEPLVEMRENA